jgi:transposase-like protein
MKINCPRPDCSSHSCQSHSRSDPSPKFKPFIRNGVFFRKSDSRFIQRYRCQSCGKQFSNSTFSPEYFQKKRRLSRPLTLLLNSAVTQRRCAKILNVNLKTVVRRYRYLAQQGRLSHEKWRAENYADRKLAFIQFDDLETSEHTKCKPLSVSLAIDAETRKILSFQVSQMPAKGPLASLALKKYGFRQDERPVGWDLLMKDLVAFVSETAVWRSDKNPHYPKYLYRHHPKAVHETTKGGRGAISGQGELKKLGFDPLFALNHTCAMLRANLSRLVRRTWSNTKNRQGLIDHLSIYVPYHNQVLTEPSR